MNNKEKLEQLRTRGLTDTQIGKATGRDSSLIRQIRLGKKPGKNLSGAFDSLLGGAQKADAPRRTTKSGEAAKVRSRKVNERPLQVSFDASDNRKEIQRILKELLKENARLSAVVEFEEFRKKSYGRRTSDSEFVLYGNGIDAETLLDDWEESGLAFDEFLEFVATEQHGADVASGAGGVTFNVVYG